VTLVWTISRYDVFFRKNTTVLEVPDCRSLADGQLPMRFKRPDPRPRLGRSTLNHLATMSSPQPISRRQRTTRSILLLTAFSLAAVACRTTSSASSTTERQPNTTTVTTTSTVASTAVSETDTTSSVEIDEDDPWQVVDPGVGNNGVLLGFSTALSRAEREPRWRDIEDASGRSFDIGHVFHSWDLAIPTEDDLMHIDDGRLLMISWNGTDTKEIAAGEHDEWIRSQARGTAGLGERVLFRWLWEMDGNRRRAWVHSGPDYVAAWNHIRAIFEQEGATNAEFVWCPNEFLFWDDGDPEPWEPDVGDGSSRWISASWRPDCSPEPDSSSCR